MAHASQSAPICASVAISPLGRQKPVTSPFGAAAYSLFVASHPSDAMLYVAIAMRSASLSVLADSDDDST